MLTFPKAAQGIIDKLRQRIRRPSPVSERQQDDLDLRFSIAAIHYEQGQTGEAIIGLRSILAANPGHPVAHFLLGRIREDTDDCEAAEREYRQAIRLDPGKLNYRLRLGAVLEKRGRAKAAMKEYMTAVALCPDDAEAHFRLGAVLDGFGQAEAAIAHYREALLIDPGYSDAAICLDAAIKRRKALLR